MRTTVRPPSREHLRALLADFPNRPGAWRVLSVHSIPIAGVALLGWSAQVVSLFFLLDILLTALAMSYALTRHVMDDMPQVTGVSRMLGFLMTWLIVAGVVGMLGLVPALMFAGAFLGNDDVLVEAFATRSAVLAVLVSIALHASHVQRWIRREDRRGSRDEMREVLGLVVFKGFAFGLLGAHVGAFLMLLGAFGQVLVVALIAAILTAAEVYRAEIMAMLAINRAFHDRCEGGAAFSDARKGEGKASESASEAPRPFAGGVAKKRKKRRTRPQSRA